MPRRCPRCLISTLKCSRPRCVLDVRLGGPTTHRRLMLRQSVEQILKQLGNVVFGDVLGNHTFYMYYNYDYWKLTLHPPYFSVKFSPVPLPTPGGGDLHWAYGNEP
jgi:hypothetical protein